MMMSAVLRMKVNDKWNGGIEIGDYLIRPGGDMFLA
jgi:hypothetical protein